MTLPSKELLSEVLGIKFYKDTTFKTIFLVDDNNRIQYEYCSNSKDEMIKTINIYELAHKCKEWAKANGYYLLSGIYTYNGKTDLTYDCLINQNFSYEDDGEFITRNENCLKSFNGFETEPEAIINACQWVLENKDKS